MKIQALGSISPSTFNVNSQGTSFTLSLSLLNVCDPNRPTPIDGGLLERVFISKAGNSLLPDPGLFACPAPDGSILFERGIADNILARTVTNNAVSLKFNVASDG